MIHPSFEKLAADTRRRVGPGARPEQQLQALGKVFDFMVQLDAGLCEGAPIPAELKPGTYDAATVLARSVFEAIARADPHRAIQIAETRPAYARPRGIDLAEWKKEAQDWLAPPVVQVPAVKPTGAKKNRKTKRR